ncbi:signal peptide protein [Rhodopirellula maiorica SM1]|uniref:Signal peptide protein n=1 Tax=Rhodopirellula maiorica SM1 TaxID=1265738 RepID=M5S613_9BACT|nr:hypothetical protein [Rhodopirellula maiorica]EMI21634.1 signal peptide protein [Rhodopirellula maiorica SM1]
MTYFKNVSIAGVDRRRSLCRLFGSVAVKSLAVAMICSTVGCITVGPDGKRVTKPGGSFAEKMPWAKKKDEVPEPYPNPVKMAATWTPDTLVQTNRTPTRGFGGRIFFYNEKSHAVPVDGTLVIHGFDENAETSDKATKRFEFTPEQFTRHFSQCDLGASYSIWVPWDAVGGEARRISLVASFRTKEGVTVQGVPATVMLPGKESAEVKIAKAERKLSTKYQEYRDAAASINTRTSGLTTTTIKRRSSRTPAQSKESPLQTFRNSMLAEKSATPSAEIMMADKPVEDGVLPASATMPASSFTR